MKHKKRFLLSICGVLVGFGLIPSQWFVSESKENEDSLLITVADCSSCCSAPTNTGGVVHAVVPAPEMLSWQAVEAERAFRYSGREIVSRQRFTWSDGALATLRDGILRKEALELTLATGERVQLRPDSYQFYADGSYVSAGFLNGEMGFYALSEYGGVISANIRREDGRLFQIRFDGVDQEWREVDTLLMAECGGAMKHEAKPAVATAGVGDAAGDTALGDASIWPGEVVLRSAPTAASVLDVVIGYNQEGLDEVGGLAAMRSTLLMVTEESNQVYQNSGIGEQLALKLVHTFQLSRNSAEVSEAELEYWTDANDGVYNELDAVKVATGADIYSAWFGGSRGYAGLGWLADFTREELTSVGHNICNLHAAASNFTFVHELGHNLGANHDPDNVSSHLPNESLTAEEQSYGLPSLFPSYGYGWHLNTNQKRTVMAYDNGTGFPRIPYFSNPGIRYNNEATGTSANATFVGKHAYQGFSDRSFTISRNNARRLPEVAGNAKDWGEAVPGVALISPVADDLVGAGQTWPIRWTSRSTSGRVDLFLLSGNQVAQVIGYNLPDTGQFDWQVPVNLSGFFGLRMVDRGTQAVLYESAGVFDVLPVLYEELFDTNPGYQVTGDWEFGTPNYTNAFSYGPSAAYSGTNIYDVKLSGSSSASRSVLTTPPIAINRALNLTLTYQSWHSLQAGWEAITEISPDGQNWTEIKKVSGFNRTYAWEPETIRLPSTVRDWSQLYIRWRQQWIDAQYIYHGMAIDDVRLFGQPRILLSSAVTGQRLAWSVDQEAGINQFTVEVNRGLGWETLTTVSPDGSLNYFIDGLDASVIYRVRAHLASGSLVSDASTEADLHHFRLEPGWNLISNPFVTWPENGLADYAKWRWQDGIYQLIEGPAENEGFWVFNAENEARTFTVFGTDSNTEEVVLSAGWNLLGPVQSTIIPAGIPAFGQNASSYNAMVPENEMLRGRGYWIYGRDGETVPLQ